MRTFAFIDESGNDGFDFQKQSVSAFYVVCALVVKEKDQEAVIAKFEDVRKRYFRGLEMKSSHLADDHKRQLVLQELSGAPFQLHLLIGNKNLIDHPGLRYPKTFVKVLNRAVYESVLKDHPNIILQADEIKDRSFMEEFNRYIEKTNPRTLFQSWTSEFVDSRQNVCIQVADVLAGTVRLCFERNCQTAMRDPLIEKLRERIVNWMAYPAYGGRYIAGPAGPDRDDLLIEARALADAEEFVRIHQHSDDPECELQVECVRLLHFTSSNDADLWVSTDMLKERLDLVASEPVTEHKARHVVACLRDYGLMVASRTSWGYKLASCKADLVEFVNRQGSQVVPMLSRISKIRYIVRQVTDGRVDILAAHEHSKIKAAVEAQPHWSEEVLVPSASKDDVTLTARQDAEEPLAASTILEARTLSIAGGVPS